MLTQLAREIEALVGRAPPAERAHFFDGVLRILNRAEGRGPATAAAAGTAETAAGTAETRALAGWSAAAGEKLAGMCHYVCQMLLVAFGQEGAASDFACTYLDARRWSALRPVFCLDLE